MKSGVSKESFLRCSGETGRPVVIVTVVTLHRSLLAYIYIFYFFIIIKI